MTQQYTLKEFYSAILSDYDSYISSRTIDYNDSSATSSSSDTGAYTTSEKIWLMSYTEANGVFYSSNDTTSRIASPSDFGLATNCFLNTSYTSNYRTGICSWWLRSSFNNGFSFACYINYSGTGYIPVYTSYYAVRPCMLLNLSSVTSTASTASATSVDGGAGSTNSAANAPIFDMNSNTEAVLLSTTSTNTKRRFALCLEN